MDFKVLCVGDVVGNPGMDRISRSLRYLKRKANADFVIVNGENAAVVGMTPQQGEDILDAGADCITMGRRNSRILLHLENNRVVPPSSQDVALCRYSVSGEVTL